MWNATLQDDYFEASTLENLSDDIASHFANNDGHIPDLGKVARLDNENICLSDAGLKQFSEICDCKHQFNIEEIQAEDIHHDQLNSDYCASIL